MIGAIRTWQWGTELVGKPMNNLAHGGFFLLQDFCYWKSNSEGRNDGRHTVNKGFWQRERGMGERGFRDGGGIRGMETTNAKISIWL
jgi:hypothetical protein